MAIMNLTDDADRATLRDLLRDCQADRWRPWTPAEQGTIAALHQLGVLEDLNGWWRTEYGDVLLEALETVLRDEKKITKEVP